MASSSITPLDPSATPLLPGGPRLPPVVNGALFFLARKPFVSAMMRRHGDAFSIVLPGIGTAVVICNPDLVRAVYTADPTVLHAGKNPLGAVLGPGSMFSLDEDDHLRERRLLLPAFHGDRMRLYEALIEEEAEHELASWPEGVEFATLPSFNRITLRVILRAVFGAAGPQLADLEQLLPEVTTLGQRLVSAPILRRDFGSRSPGGRLLALRARFDGLVRELIDEHLGDPGLDGRTDVLSLMLRAIVDSGEAVDHAAIADELLTLLVAGHETTASSLAWAVERLRRHPLVLDRLEREVDKGGSSYRTATILELQRHRTIIGGTGRRTMVPVQFGPWRIPAGTMLFTALSAVHDDNRVHPHAEGFDPDRFVDAKPGTYTWIPFGGGRRRCIGAAFALFEMDIVLRTVLRRFELERTTGREEAQSFRGVAYAPSKGGLARVRRRATPLGAAEADAASRPGVASGDAAAAGCPVAH